MRRFTNRFVNLLEENKLAILSLILFVTILWGYAWVVMKQSLTYMGPLTFTSFRFLTGSFTLLLVVWLTKEKIQLKKYWKKFFIQGLLQTTIVFTLVMIALQYVGAGKSSVLLYSMPIWSSLLATMFLKEKPSLIGWIGLTLGLIGLTIIVGWDFWSIKNKHVLYGEFLIIIASISWAISNIYFRLYLQPLSKVTTTAYQMLYGTIGIVIATLLFEWQEPIQLNVYSIYYILFSGILASALCFTIWFLLLSLVDIITATIASMLVPVFGLFFSALILNETLSFNLIIGSIVIVFGIIIAQFKRNH